MRLRTRSSAERAATSTIRKAATAGIALGALALPLVVSPAQAQTATGLSQVARVEKAPVPALRVMTRNLYLGTDIMRPLDAVAALPAGASTIDTLNALANATDKARDIVDATNFAVRSKLLARELANKQPDLVGLQEVALWREGPFELGNVAVPNATTVKIDFLKTLLAEAKARGVEYRPVSVNWLSDVEAPAYEGKLGPGEPPITNARDVRLTMRDVILKRVGSGLKVVNHQKRDYKTNLSVELAGKTLDFTRGYQWVDVLRNGTKFRFINTHLEAFSSDYALAQVKQMLAGPGSWAGPTIIVCDCNSDPLLSAIKPVDTVPHYAPYQEVVGKFGFSDTWLQWKPAWEGWTSGLSETVDDADASGFDHRIDMVFARTSDGARMRAVGGTVVGNTVASKDPATGLWPSDHAGVMMKLRGIR